MKTGFVQKKVFLVINSSINSRLHKALPVLNYYSTLNFNYLNLLCCFFGCGIKQTVSVLSSGYWHVKKHLQLLERVGYYPSSGLLISMSLARSLAIKAALKHVCLGINTI